MVLLHVLKAEVTGFFLPSCDAGRSKGWGIVEFETPEEVMIPTTN